MRKIYPLLGLAFILLISSVYATDITINNVGWYDFYNSVDEATALTDNSEFSNNATNSGAVYTPSDGFFFDGSDYININTVVGDTTTPTGILSLWVKTTTDNIALIQMTDFDSSSNGGLVTSTSNKVAGDMVNAGSWEWDLRTDAGYTGSTHYTHIMLIQNGTEPTICINGTRVAQSYDTIGGPSVDKTFWFNSLTGYDTATIGARRYFSTASAYLIGTVAQAGVWNSSNSWSCNEALEIYNKGIDYNPYLVTPKFELTLINAHNSSSIINFTAEITNSTTSQNIITTNGTVLWNLDETINITIFNITGAEGQYFNVSYTGVNSSNNFEASAFQGILNLITRNIVNTTSLVDINYTINNTNQSIQESQFINDGITTVTTFNVSEGFYTIFAEKVGYPSVNTNTTISPLDNKTVYIIMGLTATLNLIDEESLEPFNISKTDSTKVTVVCADIGSLTFELTNSTEEINITCDYTKLRFTVDFNGTIYTRNLLSSETDIFSQDVYLLDLTTTQSIFNSFIVNDYVGEYEDIELYVKKNIEGAQVIIHSDNIDVENKMSVFLIENDEYITELHSSNNPVLILGFYGADLAGDKEITITTANADLASPDVLGTGINIATFVSGNTSNTTTDLTANANYVDFNLLTTSVSWSLYYLNLSNSSLMLIYNVTTLNNNNITFVPQNVSDYQNYSIYSIIDYTSDDTPETFTKIIHTPEPNLAEQNMFQFYSANALQWGIIFLLSIMSLLGTIPTQNYVNYFILCIAGLASIFNLLTVSIVVLILSLIINFLDQMKKGDSRRIA